jgi:hypothetical protein
MLTIAELCVRTKKNRHKEGAVFCFDPSAYAATVTLRAGSFSLIRADFPLRSRK